jgi:hypothetical protein
LFALDGIVINTILLSGFRSPQSAIAEVPLHTIRQRDRAVRPGAGESRLGAGTHKSGQPIDGVPSHEWAVFTFAFEPKVEKIEQPNGATLWKVTFE